MNRQTIFIVVIVVVLVHVGFFYAATRVKPGVARPTPRENFGFKEESYRDAETGEKLTYREIKVSTKLIEPAELKRLEALRDAQLKATPAK